MIAERRVSRTNGVLEEEWWLRRGYESLLHKVDGPALIRNDMKSGTLIEQQWRRYGVFYKKGGGFNRQCDFDAYVLLEWRLGDSDGVPHRFGAPAKIRVSKRFESFSGGKHFVYGCSVPGWSNVCTGEEWLEVAVLVAFLCSRAGVKHVGPLVWEYVRLPLWHRWRAPITVSEILREEKRLLRKAEGL